MKYPKAIVRTEPFAVRHLGSVHMSDVAKGAQTNGAASFINVRLLKGEGVEPVLQLSARAVPLAVSEAALVAASVAAQVAAGTPYQYEFSIGEPRYTPVDTEDFRAQVAKHGPKDPLIERQRATAAEHLRLENKHNWDGEEGETGVWHTFTPDPQGSFFDVYALNQRFSGLASVQAFYGAMRSAFPGFQLIPHNQVDVPGRSVVELQFEGTHGGDFGGIPATGKEVSVPMMAVFLFDSEGKLRAERVSFDTDTIMRQLRGEMTKDQVFDLRNLPADTR
jgi:steroid delta-isomerase-like uncharacterized protein